MGCHKHPSPYAHTTTSLCPTGLWGQTDKHPYGAKQTPHRDRGSILIPFVMTYSQLCKYCLLWTQRTLMTLKHVYKFTRSSYSLKIFSPIRCGMSQTPPMQTQRLCYVPQDCEVKQTNSLMGSNKPHTEVEDLLRYHL